MSFRAMEWVIWVIETRQVSLTGPQTAVAYALAWCHNHKTGLCCIGPRRTALRTNLGFSTVRKELVKVCAKLGIDLYRWGSGYAYALPIPDHIPHHPCDREDAPAEPEALFESNGHAPAEHITGPASRRGPEEKENQWKRPQTRVPPEAGGGRAPSGTGCPDEPTPTMRLMAQGRGMTNEHSAESWRNFCRNKRKKGWKSDDWDGEWAEWLSREKFPRKRATEKEAAAGQPAGSDNAPPAPPVPPDEPELAPEPEPPAPEAPISDEKLAAMLVSVGTPEKAFETPARRGAAPEKTVRLRDLLAPADDPEVQTVATRLRDCDRAGKRWPDAGTLGVPDRVYAAARKLVIRLRQEGKG